MSEPETPVIRSARPPRPVRETTPTIETALRAGVANGNWGLLLAVDAVRLHRLGQLPEEPVCEQAFHPTRRWRFDLAFKIAKLGVEVDGGGFVQGRHSRGMGMERDTEKFAEAMVLGWRVLRVTTKQVRCGQAIAWIQKLLK
jgi:hypothetical protein